MDRALIAGTRGSTLDPFLAAAAAPGASPALLRARFEVGERRFAKDLLDRAKESGVEVAVADNLLRLAESDLAPGPRVEPLLAAARECRKVAVFRALRWEQRAVEAIEILSRSGRGAPVILKGGSARYTVYAEPFFRTCSDLDVLLPEADVKDGAAALVAAGYSTRTPDPARKWTSLNAHHVTLGREGFTVELHRGVDQRPRPALSFQEQAAAASPLAPFGGKALAPAPHHMVLTIAAHALKHGLATQLKNLVDLHLLAAGGRVDWEAVVSLAGRENLSVAIGYLLAAAMELFATPVSTKLLERLKPALPRLLAIRATLSPWRKTFFGPPLAWAPEKLRHAATLLLLTSGTRPLLEETSLYLIRRFHDLQTWSP
jgi:hypothetical protein